MAIFPVLEIENKVQVKDKTRISGVKTFISAGGDAVVNVSVTPGADGSPIALTPINSVDIAQENWYTDWQWSDWAFDVDALTEKIDIDELGTQYVATVANATYSSISSLATAIQTALNGMGAIGAFTVTVDNESKLTIGSTVPFKILNLTGNNHLNSLLVHLGFREMDYEFANDHTGSPVEYGIRKVSLSADDDTNPPEVVNLYQKVYTEYGDRLFATDFDLKNHEEDVLKWVSDGRSSFKDVHRRVQEMIFEYLAGHGFVSAQERKFDKWDIKDSKELRDWAAMWALQLIMEGNSNAVDDIYDRKAQKYASMAIEARGRFLALDIDGDGKVDFNEQLRLHTINLFRR